MKTCSKCKTSKPDYAFGRDGNILKRYCKVCAKQYNAEWAKQSPKAKASKKARSAKYVRKMRQEVLSIYGKVCACCGESHWRFLTIDHIDGSGSEHRRAIGVKRSSGFQFYLWLKRNNWPSGYQVLCWNCNIAKGKGKECPHQENRNYLPGLAAGFCF
jgi:hypothetical protein